VAYNYRAFSPIICWSVCVCVCVPVSLSVCSVHCGKTADQIWMRFGMVSHMGPGMRQVDGFEDRSMEGDNFWGECGVSHYN